MKIKELKDRSVGELEKLLNEEREKLRGLRFAVSTSQESKVRSLRETRKTIARIQTLLTQNAKH
jgi:large subunit ribosomal protein L29